MSIPPTDLKALLSQAEACLQDKRYQSAMGFYQQCVELEPAHAEAWIGLSMAHYRLGQFHDALPIAQQAVSLDGRQTRAWLIVAAIATQQGHPAEALIAAEKALDLEPDNSFALSCKTEALLKLKRNAEALATAESLVRLDPTNPVAHLNHGLALHRVGQLTNALQAFDQVLAISASMNSAWINRSSVLLELDRAEDALRAADAALAIQPTVMALLNRTAALLRLKQPREALATANRLLELNPQHFKGLMNRAIALQEIAEYQNALTTIKSALRLEPAHAGALELKIKALLGLRQFAEAETEAWAALLRNPGYSGFKLRRAEALIELKRSIEAERYLDEVLANDPKNPEALLLKAAMLVSRSQWQAAWSLVKPLRDNASHHPGVLLMGSTILLGIGRYGEALLAVDELLKSEPGHRQAAINRVAALNGLNRFAEALSATQELLEQGVRDWQVYANYGGALAGLERFDEARQAFVTAHDLDPSAFRAFRTRHEIHGVAPDALMPELDPRAESLALRLERLERGDWREYATLLERAATLIQQGLAEGQLAPIPPFKTLSLPFPPALNLAVARSRGDFLSSGMQALRQQLAFSDPAPGAERLRIGYVSADFRQHPTAHLMRSLFRLHDRNRFAVYIYALCRDDGSAYYQQIKANADQFVDLTGLSNVEAATRIHADGIHMLVDLMGYTAYARTEIFALQPAPVQVSYLGYPGTLGLPCIPYILADPVVLPAALLPFFTEQPVYLPECYQVNDRWQAIAETGVQRQDVGLPETGFVFCCFNQPTKLDPLMFQVWMRILNQVAGSVLWLLASDPEVAGHLRREAERCGVAGERLIFAERLPKDRHLERHRLADLFLDTRIYNAHTTASDALWAGLPVLTCMGEVFPARVAASLLQAVGLPELITHALDEYEQLAVRLATQPELLAALRAKLANLRLRTPLFDTERFARHLERAFEMMWERHVEGLPPAPLRVSPLDKH